MAQDLTYEEGYDRWVWLDMEMTGLDETFDVPLQVAMVITDYNCNILAEKEITIWQPEAKLSHMVPYVKSMHTKNGLLDKVRFSSYSLAQCEEEMLELLSKNVGYKKGVLAGNSIYVDRKFLVKYFPTFHGYLHYRQIDISSFKVVGRAWYGLAGLPSKKVSNHTALDDIKNSIEELKFYKDRVFRDSVIK